MAPTEGRVAKPEWRWDCRSGTSPFLWYVLLLKPLHTRPNGSCILQHGSPATQVDRGKCHNRSTSS